MKSLLLMIVFLSTNAISSTSIEWSELESKFREHGGNVKSLRQVQCFLEKSRGRNYSLKKPSNTAFNTRCFSKSKFSLGNSKTFAIIDYTKASNEKRMFLINRQTGSITSFAAAHGRYKAGHFNRRVETDQNSVKWARYFSNTKGSNAPSSGFYFAGQEYVGKWGRSLVLHGLEKNINDNSCERAVVIHKHKLVSKRKARMMSSGCPMISGSVLDTVINSLKGVHTGFNLKESGGLVYIYSPRESEWADSECGQF